MEQNKKLVDKLIEEKMLISFGYTSRTREEDYILDYIESSNLVYITFNKTL